MRKRKRDTTMKFKTILLFGAPGSGKGTQGQILGSIPGLVHVACGEIFRGLRVGLPARSCVSGPTAAGALWSPMISRCSFGRSIFRPYPFGPLRPGTDVLILDGIPRNVAQARLMDDHIDVKRLYYLDCEDKEKMYLRLKRRALHENRLDDASDATIQSRPVCVRSRDCACSFLLSSGEGLPDRHRPDSYRGTGRHPQRCPQIIDQRRKRFGGRLGGNDSTPKSVIIGVELGGDWFRSGD